MKTGCEGTFLGEAIQKRAYYITTEKDFVLFPPGNILPVPPPFQKV